MFKLVVFVQNCIGLAMVTLLLVLMAPGQQAYAQAGLISTSGNEASSAPKVPEDLTPEAVRQLLSKLDDQQVRQLLLERLDAVAKKQAEAKQNEDGRYKAIAKLFVGVWESSAIAVQKMPHMSDGIIRAIQNFTNSHTINSGLLFLLYSGLAIVAGYAAEYIGEFFARRWRTMIRSVQPEGLFHTVRLLVLRCLLDIGGILIFWLFSYLAVKFLIKDSTDRFLANSFIFAFIVFQRLLMAFSRFIIAPNRPNLRLVSLDDQSAQRMYWLWGIAVFVMALNIFVAPALHHLGLQLGEARIGYWLFLALHITVIWILWSIRSAVTQIIMGDEENVPLWTQRLAHAWPIIAIVLTIINWIFVEILVGQKRFDLLQGQQYITLILIAFAPALDTAVRGIVNHLVPPMIGEGAIAERAYISTKRSYIRIGRVILLVLLVGFVGEMWDVNLSEVANVSGSESFGDRAGGAFVIITLGYIIWEVITLYINRKLAKEYTDASIDLDSDEPGGGEGGGTGLSRLATILPLVLLTAQVTIATITVLLALGELDFNITPLLAGAGVVGLAVGFGAQTLVRDIVSGIFFLVDDAFRVGEYLVIDNTVGTVEKISVRSLQLRHHTGPIHTIPYGEIPKVTNNSRDWVIMKLKFTVPFDTDVNKIKKLFKAIGAEILETADYAEDLLQTFKSQGVFEVNDVGIVIRGKFMSKPGKQWVIRKDIYARVQKAFDANGIEFARKEVRVNISGNADAADDSTIKTIAGAAAEAAEDPPKTPAP